MRQPEWWFLHDRDFDLPSPWSGAALNPGSRNAFQEAPINNRIVNIVELLGRPSLPAFSKSMLGRGKAPTVFRQSGEGQVSYGYNFVSRD